MPPPSEAVIEAVAEERKRRTLAQWALLAALAMLVAVVIVGLGGRLIVLSPAGRELVSTFVNGKSLGRYGRINVYGLKGDVWNNFTLDRVTVTDRKGVWLDARKVHIDWTWTALIGRRFHADLVEAQGVQVIRRPELEPQLKPPGPMPLGVLIDRFDAKVELLEGFSKEYGRWTLTGQTRIERVGEKALRLDARSLTRPGDYLKLDGRMGGAAGLKLDAEAFEAKGGPIAGAMGYSPDLPFVIDAKADGAVSAGRFHALVRSGGFTPLKTDGTWDKAGATASGWVALSGSDLLLPFAHRLGGSARFGLAARPVSKGRVAMGWVVLADNLTIRAQGVIDPQARNSTDGITLDAATPSLARLTGAASAGGAARFQGGFKGDPYAFALKGAVTIEKVNAGGYGLASVSGPVDVSFANGRYDIETEVQGAGGAGRGALGALLGPRPKAAAALTWFADGSLLLRRFKADGAGLSVSGTGGRNLLGGLSFRGKATVVSVGALRKGAKGSLDADLSASRAKGAYPWMLTIDARGRRLTTGIEQVDRLLGTEPRLRAHGAFDHGQAQIAEALLDGKAAHVKAAGLAGLDGSLKLALDWTAKGPFAVGPVEFAGDAMGGGALTGSIDAPRADFKSHFDQIDAGPVLLMATDVTLTFQRQSGGYDGRIALLGTTTYGPARAGSAFRFEGDGVRLEQLSVDAAGVTAEGALSLRRGAPSSADLRFAAGPGAFVASGHAAGSIRITDGPADAEALVDVSASNLQLRGSPYVFNTLRLSGRGTLERLPFAVTADVAGTTPVKFTGSGVYSRVNGAQGVALNGQGSIRGAAFKTLSPLAIGLSAEGETLKADLSVGTGRLTAEGRRTKSAVELRADLTGVDVRALNPDVSGTATATLSLKGQGERLEGTLDASFAKLRSRDGPRAATIDGTLQARLGGGRLSLTAAATGAGGLKASATAELPVVASASPLRLAVIKTRPISGRFDVAGEVKPIWDVILGGERSLSGQVQTAGTFSGTLNDPHVDGAASIRGGRLDDAAIGLSLRDMTADIRFDRSSATVTQFSAGDGSKEGKVTAEGRLNLSSGGESNFTLNLARFQLIDNDIATARATGPVTVTRAGNGQIKLTGKLRIDRAEIAPNPPTPSGVVQMDVVEINAPPGRQQFTTAPRGAPIQLDVDLRAPGQVYVRGRGLDLEMSLNAHVGGTTVAPILTGDAGVVRGDFDFAGKRFVFDDRGTVKLSTHPEQIRLDLRAEREDPTLTAVVLVRGTAAKPEITLTSTPALPQDEVLSQVLFGRSASQLSPLEAAQLASSVASLSGGGGLDIIGNLREFAGLDRLAFGGDAASGLTIAGGKYVTDTVYLELIGGGVEGPAVEVQWRVRKQVSVISRVTGQGTAKLSVRWRKDLH